MRLYLSSLGLGNARTVFRDLVKGQRVGVVLNALDNAQEAREDWLTSQSRELAKIGFEVQELDLRSYFGQSPHLQEAIEDLDAIWVNGGNTFVLRRAMRASGFDQVIKAMLHEDRIVYGGFSAGVVVLHNSLKGLEIVDDPNAVPDGYALPTVWEGLGIIPFSVVVHYQSAHPEAEAVEGEAQYYEKHSIPYRTLRDGQALVLGDDIKGFQVVGSPN